MNRSIDPIGPSTTSTVISLPYYELTVVQEGDPRSDTTIDNLSDDVLVHILCFLCPTNSGNIQLLDMHIGLRVIRDKNLQLILQWPHDALTIARTCKRMYRLLFLDPNYDHLFWHWHCFIFDRRVWLAREELLTYRTNPDHEAIWRPKDSRGYPDFSKRGIVVRNRARFFIPMQQRRISQVGSEEQQKQPNYYRLLTADQHMLHEEFCQDLQRQEDSRYRKFNRVRFIKTQLRNTVLRVFLTAIFVNCLTFYGLQTLRGFLHWILSDILQLAWYDLPSRILLHISWLPAWFSIILLFTLTTLAVLYNAKIRSNRNGIKYDYLALVISKIIIFAIFITLLLLYLDIVLPKRSGGPTWLQSEYIPWNLTTVPLILIFLPVACMWSSHLG